ncbi:hypothetical protein [Listeria ivanovii]|uniref:Uncharacterized protein n=2 Tax=Listeria ivanovii TaxID=1638 RepID=A0ABS1G627_LISIV|nr:hypothetical protein [Listeria ivanovii]EFR95772.1 conserved hypothetical protein [Listeria ivanovii FSL F6-596]AIS60891.1 hypothetical protein JL58_13300 [Listeria ivanovii subsp. londoniensis]AIS63717.1 hypothetical protein JL53_13785 [Listeria ivanovii subsp. londoniensis]MBC2254950.1 hypothetical protein [Listeria ivanovii]MBK1962328.1 hypothetical protein [Listeria ivanovii subsp. londoniensis]
MEEQVDLGHFLKKAFIVMIALTLVFIGILATLTIIGVVIAIPLLKKGSKMLLQTKEGVEHSHGGKLKLKCPACHAKMKFKDSDFLDEK